MILTVDIGNTHTVLGGFEKDELIFTARISTESKQTEDEWAIKIFNALTIYRVNPNAVNGAILSSVVPPLNTAMKKAIQSLFGIDPIVVGPGIKTGINIHCDIPSSVGTDIICACVATHYLYGSPAMIIDMGTATKLMVVNKAGAFIGVSIVPGVMMGLDALSEKTAQLPKISLNVPERIVAKNTADSIKSGAIFGNASMIDGMIDRVNEEIGEVLPVYATGGMSSMVLPHCKHKITRDEHLVLKGLNILYKKNQ